jgi:hypothetical protein
MLINNLKNYSFDKQTLKSLSSFIPLNKNNRLPIIGFNMQQKIKSNVKYLEIPLGNVKPYI